MTLESVLDFFFPPQCGGCNEIGSGLCERCASPDSQLRRTQATLHVDALGPYEGDLRRAVLALKSGRRDVARAAALRLAELTPADAAIVPVPTTLLRRLERGFDGCVLMAQTIAAVRAGTVIDGLRQVRGDRQRGRSRGARLAARGRFQWHGERLDGMQAVLLDDVVTTGATLEDCANVIRAAGGAVSRAIAIALTP